MTFWSMSISELTKDRQTGIQLPSWLLIFIIFCHLWKTGGLCPLIIEASLTLQLICSEWHPINSCCKVSGINFLWFLVTNKNLSWWRVGELIGVVLLECGTYGWWLLHDLLLVESIGRAQEVPFAWFLGQSHFRRKYHKIPEKSWKDWDLVCIQCLYCPIYVLAASGPRSLSDACNLFPRSPLAQTMKALSLILGGGTWNNPVLWYGLTLACVTHWLVC